MEWTYDEPGAPMELKFITPQVKIEFGKFGGLTVEGDYTVTISGQEHSGNGAREPEPETAAAVVEFTSDLTARAWVGDKSDLYLESKKGHVLHAMSQEKWESWNFHAPDGMQIICTPGGELSTWGPYK